MATRNSLTWRMEHILSPFIPKELPAHVDVSVVICTRNRECSFKKLPEATTCPAMQPLEIIVVDNAPSDESTKVVVDQYPGIIYCKEARPGLDIARNSGAKMAKGSIVAYVDDDVAGASFMDISYLGSVYVRRHHGYNRTGNSSIT